MSTTPDVTCLGCGCVCDDIELKLRDNQIVTAKNACPIGEAWFQDSREQAGPACWIDGKAVDLEQGIDRAVEILANARYPLVYGLSKTTTDSQRIALSIADLTGACVDTSAAVRNGPFLLALQDVGEVTCTLGEIKNRGDLILLWACDPARTHPRHFERYSLHANGRFVSAERSSRYCVTIHANDVECDSDADVDQVIAIRPKSDFECFWTLRALARGVTLDSNQVEISTGVPLTVWQSLMERMKQANYGAIVFGHEIASGPDGRARSHAMLSLVRDLNAHARFVCVPLGAPGNGTGAENVLTAATGYPFAVSLAHGYPRFGPGDYSAEGLLSRGEADAALIVAAGDLTADLSTRAREHLAKIPTVVIDHRESALAGATVGFLTSKYGIHTPGTVYRPDHVPIPIRPALTTTRPHSLTILRAIEQRLRVPEATL
jgi:formylmethanofuran dehydrogenase subunit B